MRVCNSRKAAIVAAILPFASAQTYTSCDPLTATCPADPGLSAANFNTDFTSGSSASWSLASGTTLNYGTNGAEFTIAKAGQAPTISSNFYIFFGRVDVQIKAAPGTGIVSSIVLESDTLDEIDWEFLGGNSMAVQTNFFGKGNTTVYDRMIQYNVANTESVWHTYSVDWNADRLEYLIDGVVVRTIPYNDPLTIGGTQYPQTPMRVKLGNWAGGGPGEPAGTVEWAGGATDFSQAPFTMYVASVNITNYNPGSSYTYTDKSGSYKSISVAGGTNNAGSSSSSSASSTTSGATTVSSSATAPTSSLSVAPLGASEIPAVSTTISGAAYSTNTASIIAQNTNATTFATSTTTRTGTSTTTSASVTPSGNAGSKAVAGMGLIGGLAAGLALL